MRNRKRLRPVTLIELMIVIVLIGLIGGVVAYNLRGSLDVGKKFKTKMGTERIRDILLLEYAQGKSKTEIEQRWQEIIKESGLVNNPQELLVDGFGNEYKVKFEGDDLIVSVSKT